jgi:excisionase family DNA binding protein
LEGFIHCLRDLWTYLDIVTLGRFFKVSSLGAFSVTHDTLTVTTDDTLTQDRVTIQEACKIANISRKTLYRWIEKGLLSREKDGNRAYVSLAEVQTLCVGGDSQQVTESVSGDMSATQQDITRVTLDREHYEGLLVRLGQLEAEKRYLLEYRQDAERKDKTIADQQTELQAKECELAEIRAENERLKQIKWWERLFRRW